MATLGDLERAVMDVLWSQNAADPEETGPTANELRDLLAQTTGRRRRTARNWPSRRS